MNTKKETDAKWKALSFAAVAGLCLAVAGFATGANINGFYLDRGGFHMFSGEYLTITGPAAASGESGAGGAGTAEGAAIADIEIDVVTADVSIAPARKYGYEITCAKESNFTSSLTDGRLVIKQLDAIRPITLRLTGRNDKIDIYLPDGASLGTVDIKSLSGDFSASGLTCKRLNCKLTSGGASLNGAASDKIAVASTSGDIKIMGAKADQFDISLVSGNLKASGVASGGMGAKLTSGDASLSGAFDGDTSIQTASGGVRLEIDGGERDYNLNVGTTSGGVKINGAKSSAGYVDHGAAKNLGVRTTSGSIKINFNK